MKTSLDRKVWLVTLLYVLAGGAWTYLVNSLFAFTASHWPVILLQMVWVSATAVLLFFGFHREQKATEEANLARRISQERFLQLAEHTLGFFYRYRLTAPAGFEYVSPTAVTILGHSPEALYANPGLGRSLLQAEDQPSLETVIARGSPPELPVVVNWPRPDNTSAWLEQRYVLVHDEIGQLVAIQGVVRDVTERKRAEKALVSELRFVSAVFETAESLVFMLDPQGHITGFNRACERMMGYAFDEVRGKVVWDLFLSPEDAPAARASFQNLRPEQFPFKSQTCWLTRNGERRLVDWSYAALVGDQGAVETIVGIGIDITQRKAAEDSLDKTAESLKVWVDKVERHDRQISQVNKMGELLQACTSTKEAYEVIAQSARQLFPTGVLYAAGENKNLLESAAVWGDELTGNKLFAPTDCWALRRGQAYLVLDTHTGLLCQHLDNPPPACYLCVPLMTQSEPLGVLYLQCQPDGSHDPEAAPANRILAAQQIAQIASEQIALALANLKLRETLRSQAIRDALTGLFNRRYMEESLDREMHRAVRNKTSLSLVLMDLDHFKHFNDAFGHDAGDLVLRELGLLLKAHVRRGDIPCRYGGEEFLLVMPEASIEAAQQRAETLREEVKLLKLEHLGRPLGEVTLSLGVAAYPQHGTVAEEVLRAADRALYRAKSEGRDRVVAAHSSP